MEITKFLHSCLYIQTQTSSILIDPGIYTYQDHVLNLTKLPSLTYLLITHEHADHMYLPFIKEIITQFPHAQIITNNSVRTLLEKEGIASSTQPTPDILLTNAFHEKMFEGTPPENTVFTVFNQLTHPGDSLSFNSTSSILALPIQAPWGSVTWAVEKAIALNPRHILPIHDWYWKDSLRQQMYQRLSSFFLSKNITFHPMETGETITIT